MWLTENLEVVGYSTTYNKTDSTTHLVVNNTQMSCYFGQVLRIKGNFKKYSKFTHIPRIKKRNFKRQSTNK